MMIQDKAVLVNFSCGVWTARKKDERVAAAAGEKYHSDRKMVSSQKSLIAKARLAKIIEIRDEFRDYHYHVTLPYRKPYAILPTITVPEYIRKAQEYNDKFRAAVDLFVCEYEAAREEARESLQGLFRETDYPKVREIKRKFDFVWDVMPIPSGENVRISLDESDLQDLQQEIEIQVRNGMESAVEAAWMRLYEVCAKFRERMDVPEEGNKTFRNTLLDNIKKQVEILPSLDFTSDKRLTALAQELETSITTYEPDALRKDRELKKEALTVADQILAKIDQARGAAPADSVKDESAPIEKTVSDPETKDEPDLDPALIARLKAAGIL